MSLNIEIVSTIIGLSIIVVTAGMLLLSGSVSNIKTFTNDRLFYTKKWLMVSLILLLNVAGCVMVYYLQDLRVVVYIILALKSKDILLSVMFPFTMLWRKFTNKTHTVSFNDKVERVIAFIPTYRESQEQITKTVNSVLNNQIDRHYLLTCIVADGVLNDYRDIITEKIKTVTYTYKSWLNRDIELGIIYGTRNDKHVMLMVKHDNNGKKDSILLCNDIFNYPRSNMSDSMKQVRAQIREDIEKIFGTKHFDYMFSTDGDTFVSENAVMSMMASIISRNAVASCGVVNADKTSGHAFWNNLQNFQYLYGQYMRRTSEDLFSQVLCLPGCISMFKLNEESTAALEKYSRIPDSSDVVDACIQYVGTDRRYTSCLVYTNENAKIVMDTDANAYTVPPANFKAYVSQRKRWCQNMFFNTILNIVGPNVTIISRLFSLIDILRLSLIYFRIFNTVYFIYLLCSHYNTRDILQYIPFIVILVYPTVCFLIYSLFNSALRSQFFMLFVGLLVNKLFTILSTSVVFTSMLINIGNKSWK